MFSSKRNDPSSHLLELEAADYFKLDPAQVNMLCNSSPPLATSQQQQQQQPKTSTGTFTSANVYVRPTATMNTKLNQKSPIKLQKSPTTRGVTSQQLCESATRRRSQSECTQLIAGHRNGRSEQPATSTRTSRQTKRSKVICNKEEPTVRQQQQQQQQQPDYDQTPIYSSTASTNSLPSISSSPSISPSLVCPHLTLDDILNGRYVSRSPHTIGLCDRCKLDPPPNIHSPLSPVYKPTSATMMNAANNRQVPRFNQFSDHRQQQQQQQQPPGRKMSSLRRGYSDFQGANARNRQTREDSLDFYLDPSELRRSQMSPIQRNSVEFIRKYSTEVGRVLKVYKNGQAFEKPLRICITRNEFANLNQLLDHINSRQLIPCGARYLFHMDGQLVYSVNELKHGSSYIVSGTRNFDTKASAVIKEQQKKELNQTHHLHEQLQRRLLDRRSSRSLGSLGQLARSDDTAEAAVMAYNLSELSKDRPTQSAARPRQAMAGSGIMKPQQTESKPMVDQSVDRTSKQRVPLHRDAANSNKRRISSPKKQQQIRSNMSRSSENLNHTQDDISGAPMSKPKGGNLSRAKSELSSSALKRKKNVTFMDTGQSASPVMRRTAEGVEKAEDTEQPSGRRAPPVLESSNTYSNNNNNNNKKTIEDKDKDKGSIERNEIGIQVSDSIDGYLIDLPLPLPKRGDEKREQLESRRRFVSMRGGKQQLAPSKTRKIVTITERDLSLDELDKLKDLDHGDHHSESHKIKHVVIKLDSVEDNAPGETVEALKVTPNTSGQKSEEKVEEASKEEEAIDRTGTINIGQEDEEKSDKLITKTNFGDLGKDAAKTIPIGQWQYPGGEQSSATPEERPVSQNQPNGVVNARVTTPTPSLSTVGDNNSLSMSYDATQIDSKAQRRDGKQDKLSATRKALPAKNRVPVMGKLSSGVDPPGKNFRLTWVNGFSINNLYPDNSTTAATAASALSTGLLSEPSVLGGQEVLLSPAKQAMTAALQRGTVQFRPSERYRNWICHSRLHDELIFPAGCLVVLWCRWTNEQRYYARHSTNISAIALAPTHLDAVASAEIGATDLDQPATGAAAAAVIHLWSSTSLETLMIIDEPAHFRGFKIFSLSLKKLPAEDQSWSLQVGSKDDKQTLQLHAIKINLATDGEMQKKASLSIIKAPSRVLQPNQIPLLVSHVPVENEAEAQTPSSPAKKKTEQASDLFLSFGRRHFQLWSPDWSRQKLQLMTSGEKGGSFAEIITRANCLARLAPSEFLIGDTTGNISLFTLSFPQQQQQQQQRTPSKSLLKLGESPPKSGAGNSKFDVQIIRLVERQPQPDSQMNEQTSASRSSTPTGPMESVCSITSLTRVSGSIFASGHSNCVVRFWKIERTANDISCRQLTCLSLPPDLGFVCSILSSNFNRKQSIVEFYLISTSNAILFGSIQLASLNKPELATDVLAHSSLSVVYEGHETSVTNLVEDSAPAPPGKKANDSSSGQQQAFGHYFTCSLDFKICKWNGKGLVWKSMLPSACVSLAVHPTGSALAIGSADGTVYVLDKVSGLLISYFPLTPVCINCLSYSHDGTLLAAGCSNGSIFILPVQLNGLKYKKVSIFQSPFPVVSLQFSLDNRYLLTSVTHSQYQDLILWDLPNFRYMRDNVRTVADKIDWFEPVCSGSEDVRAIWENINLTTAQQAEQPAKPNNRLTRKRPSTVAALAGQSDQKFVVNLSCHRLIEQRPDRESLCIASDTRGHLRMFKYPCRDIEQAFYQARVTSSRLNCCRFLSPKSQSFVSSALDGSIFLWTLDSTQTEDGNEQ